MDYVANLLNESLYFFSFSFSFFFFFFGGGKVNYFITWKKKKKNMKATANLGVGRYYGTQDSTNEVADF